MSVNSYYRSQTELVPLPDEMQFDTGDQEYDVDAELIVAISDGKNPIDDVFTRAATGE